MTVSGDFEMTQETCASSLDLLESAERPALCSKTHIHAIYDLVELSGYVKRDPWRPMAVAYLAPID